MAKLRKGVAYRRIERPYTRRSKYREKSFIKGSPRMLIVRFDMGTIADYKYEVSLVAKDRHQIRQNGIESARKAINRRLETRLGKTFYHFKIRKYPHHVLRENPLASGAGADRLSKGMKLSFGKTIGLSVQIKDGEKILSVFVNTLEHLATAKDALRVGRSKLPMGYRVLIEERK
jgi:large subunit ribosomal protein L10e